MVNITQTCSTCGKQFLVIDKEQQFLQEKGLALPTSCPTCRQTRRLKLRGERALYRAKCSKCDKDIIVSYDPKTVKNQILCKQDYDQYFLDNDPIIADPLPEA
ncbi:MAG: zinc-ribbon domain containing protein [Candidatus Levyibacteriota bacterium]